MIEAGFDIVKGDSAIVPFMLYDAKLSQEMSNLLLEEGVLCNRFLFPGCTKWESKNKSSTVY